MNYIGSKLSILDYIDDVFTNFVNIDNNNITFCDIFAGTSSVGKYFKNKGMRIISNDIQYYSYVTAKHYIENNQDITFDSLKRIGINNVFDFLNNLTSFTGFIYANYTISGTQNEKYQRQYFTEKNAMKIDSIRIQIEEWKNNGLLSQNEYYYLLSCLIEAADRVANTASVYEAFLKEIKKSAQKELQLLPLDIIKNDRENLVYNEDANNLIRKIEGDVLYLDPPYNTRKYDTNYHILETIALYDNPEIKGKTGVRAEETKRSKYCKKQEVELALEELIKNAKFKYILLSYNNEGIVKLDRIKEIMSKYGKYKRYQKEHKRYKADNRRKYTKNYTIEYLHCLEK